MASQKKNRDVSIVHFSFFDLLFGAFGAFVFLMIMQVISTLNLVDIDLQNIVDRSIEEKRSLEQRLARYKEIDKDYHVLQSQYKQALAERDRSLKSQTNLNQLNQELKAEISKLNEDITELDQLKSELKKKDAIQKNLAARIDRLKKESLQLDLKGKKLEKKIAAYKTLPLKILTTSFPTTIAGDKINLALAAEGGTPPYTWSLDGRLPSGLSFNAMRGTISGVAKSVGNFSFKVKIKDGSGMTAATKDAVAFKIIKKPKDTPSTLSPWFMVMTVISILLLAYIMWGKYKARQHYKKMIAEGWKLQWIK
jgi:hypothetical protein